MYKQKNPDISTKHPVNAKDGYTHIVKGRPNSMPSSVKHSFYVTHICHIPDCWIYMVSYLIRSLLAAVTACIQFSMYPWLIIATAPATLTHICIGFTTSSSTVVSSIHDGQVGTAGKVEIDIFCHALCPLNHLVQMAIQSCDDCVEQLKGIALDVLVQRDIICTKEGNGVLMHVLHSYL